MNICNGVLAKAQIPITQFLNPTPNLQSMKGHEHIQRTRWWIPAAFLLGGLFQANVSLATTCAQATVINPASLPIVGQSLVCGAANDLNSTNVPGTLCVSLANAGYKNGIEALYAMTPTVTGNYTISIAGQTWTSIQVWNGCPNLGGTCVNSIGTSTSSKSLVVSLNAGTLYYIWFDTWPTPNSPCPGTFGISAPAPPGCTNGVSFTSYTPSCIGTPEPYATCTYAGEFNTLALTGGTAYTFGSNIATDYLTVTTSTGSILTAGTQPVNFTPGSSGSYRVYVHTNPSCGTASACRTPNVTCGTPPPAEVCTYNVPASGTSTITTCSGTVCDPGGTGNYPNNANGILVINPGTPGDNVRLTFNSFQMECCCDFLRVFDGNSTAAPQLFSGNCTTLPPVLTASGGPLTIQFTSDISVVGSGFNATISCVAPPPPAPCLTAGFGEYPTGPQTPVCDGNVNAVSPTDAWAGEWTTMALTAGVQYSFTSSIASDWISISNATGTVGLAFGLGPVTFTPGTTANYRFYTHANAACAENTTNRTRRVQCLVPPACAAAPTSPANAASLCFDGQLSWPAVALATGYDVYLDAGAGPATTLVSSNQAGTSYSAGALAAGDYSWRVEPRNSAGAATSCANWSFEALASPTASASNDGPACVGQNVQLTGVTDATTFSWSGPNGFVSTDISPVLSNVGLADAGDYTLTADNGSCTFSSTTTVVVNEVAPAPTATGHSAICVNGAVPPGQGLTATAAPITGSASATYTAGAIPTNSIIDVTCNGPANLAVNIPPGAVVTGVNVSYVFEGIGFDGWMNEQRSRLVCLSTGLGESGPQAGGYFACTDATSGASTCGSAPGLVTYIRNGLSIANGISATGVVNFQMQAYRTWNGTPGGCNSVQNRINNGTWTVTVNYEIPASIIWFDAASGGTQVGSGSPFNPVAANAVDASIGGFYTLYAAVNDPNCPSARLPAIFAVGDQITTFELSTDLQGSQTTWEIVNVDNNVTVCSGGPYFDGFAITLTDNCCMPAGCYSLRVFDSAGDGMVNGTTGGYELRNAADNRRIIDNKGNGTFGSVSQITGNPYSFCMPMGDVEPIYTSCDKFWWRSGEYLVATPDDAVSAVWVDGGANNVQSPTTGYEFWFYNPNGGYSFRRFRSHNISDGYGNVGATRTCHMRVNNWAVANHIPQFDLMNVRIRTRIFGTNGAWGPACRFIRNEALSQCPPTKLMDIPGNQFLSCGQFRQFVNNQRIHSRPVSGASQYQWRFHRGGERGDHPHHHHLLPEPGLGGQRGPQLQAGKTYEVDVRAFRNGAWCIDPLNPDSAWGDVCLLTITSSAQAQTQNIAMAGEGGINLWPNPNQGDQFWLNLQGIAADVLTVAVDIHDLTGKRVLAREIPVNDGQDINTVIDLNGDLANGVYMVSIIAGEQRYTERLVITK